MSNIASTLVPNARVVGFTATGTVSANNVQAAIAELDTEKSPTTHTIHAGEAVSQTASGYKKFADGTILQWGTTNSIGTSSITVTFPLVFPVACWAIGATNSSSVGNYGPVMVTSYNSTQFTIARYNDGANSAPAMWQAIGR